MDRILTRLDQEGNAVVFLPESYRNGKLLAWYGQSNVAPEYVSMDYYKKTKELDDTDSARLKKQYEKALSAGPVVLMQRFPRGLLHKMQEQEAKQAAQKAPPPAPVYNRRITDRRASPAEQQHYRALKAVKAGNFWRVLDDQGETLELVASEQAAMQALEQRIVVHH